MNATQPTMNIFVSRPTVIGHEFEVPYSGFDAFLISEGFTLRRLGKTDYSKKPPLKAVIDLVNECCGAIVLGYPQMEFTHESRRSAEVQTRLDYVFPTPWNQIEGALAYSMRTPIMVIGHPGIGGGVFDHGITGEAVIHLDLKDPEWFRRPEFAQPYREWLAEVRICSGQRAAPLDT
jgi:hypothetical protein